MPTIPIPPPRPSSLHPTAAAAASAACDAPRAAKTARREARRQRRVRPAPALAKADASDNRLLYATPELDGAGASLGHGARDDPPVRRASRRRTCRSGWSCCRGPTGRSAPPTSSRAAGPIRRTTTSLKRGGTITRRSAGEPLAAGQVLSPDVRPAARRPDHSGRQAHRLDDLLERPRLHAVAEAGHRADDRHRQIDADAARSWWSCGFREGNEPLAI